MVRLGLGCRGIYSLVSVMMFDSHGRFFVKSLSSTQDEPGVRPVALVVLRMSCITGMFTVCSDSMAMRLSEQECKARIAGFDVHTGQTPPLRSHCCTS